MSPLTTKPLTFQYKKKISIRKYVCRCLCMTLHLIFYKVKLFSHSRWPKKGTFIPTFAYWKHEHHKKMSLQQDKWQSKNTLKQNLISTPFREILKSHFFLNYWIKKTRAIILASQFTVLKLFFSSLEKQHVIFWKQELV